MPIDDNDILAKMRSLEAKLDQMHGDRANLVRLHEVFRSITKTEQGDLPQDRGARSRMTPTRRQLIYDAALVDFAALP